MPKPLTLKKLKDGHKKNEYSLGPVRSYQRVYGEPGFFKKLFCTKCIINHIGDVYVLHTLSFEFCICLKCQTQWDIGSSI